MEKFLNTDLFCRSKRSEMHYLLKIPAVKKGEAVTFGYRRVVDEGNQTIGLDFANRSADDF